MHRIRITLAALLLMASAGSAAAAAAHLRPADLEKMPVPPAARTEAYGTDPRQFGELRLPAGKGPFPVVVIVHGGCWTKGFATLAYMRPLAAELAAKGVATWNIEYRQMGEAGAGWPGSFLDWAAGADHLRDLAKTYPLDLSRVVATGHSAGAHAVLWLAAREKLPATSPIKGGGRPLKLKAVVGIDGPGDLAGLVGRDAKICGKPVIAPFMGGAPAEVADRYAQGSPAALLPVAAKEAVVASTVMTAEEGAAYRAAAAARRQDVEVLVLKDAGHFDMLSPATEPGQAVEALLLKALRR
jgi:acetyl esterase/lipase